MLSSKIMSPTWNTSVHVRNSGKRECTLTCTPTSITSSWTGSL
jgi:hypothetical protein